MALRRDGCRVRTPGPAGTRGTLSPGIGPPSDLPPVGLNLDKSLRIGPEEGYPERLIPGKRRAAGEVLYDAARGAHDRQVRPHGIDEGEAVRGAASVMRELEHIGFEGKPGKDEPSSISAVMSAGRRNVLFP